MSDKLHKFSPDREMEKKASLNMSIREKDKKEGLLVLREQLSRRCKENDSLRRKVKII
jgi:hypothetical protein